MRLAPLFASGQGHYITFTFLKILEPLTYHFQKVFESWFSKVMQFWVAKKIENVYKKEVIIVEIIEVPHGL